jgi:hypothetical protein
MHGDMREGSLWLSTNFETWADSILELADFPDKILAEPDDSGRL